MNKNQLDDTDLQIINALQIEPRMPWTSLARIIGLDSVTLARRWERITANGWAWISAVHEVDAPRTMAIVEIQCDPGKALTTAAVASQDPAIYSIDMTSGFRDIIMTLSAKDDEELADYILVTLGQLPAIRLLRTHIVNVSIKTGAQWNLRALTERQAAQIPRFRPPRPGASKVISQQIMTAVAGILEKNARATNVEVSEILGISPQRVGDIVAVMREQGALDLRVVIAQPYSNWPTLMWYFIRVPSSTINSVNTTLAGMPEVQFAAATTGQWNLIMAMSARNMSDVPRMEAKLETRLPGATIMDRSMVVRVFKHLGHILDGSGRATGEFISLVQTRGE